MSLLNAKDNAKSPKFSTLNARGDVFPLISWLGLVLVALIIGYWFFSNFFVGKNVLERVENDLKNIRKMVDDACDAYYYNAEYNPFTEEGSLDSNSSHICIRTPDLNKCRPVLCDNLAEGTLPLSEIGDLNVLKERDSNTVQIVRGD